MLDGGLKASPVAWTDGHCNFGYKKDFLLYFFLRFLVMKNPGSELEPDQDSLEMLDPDPDSMNADPQLWFSVKCYLLNKVEHRAYHCIV
jgi:hypothetical protein